MPKLAANLSDRLGYQGWIGCEYIPRGDTVQGLAWARRYL
jgi:hydroxypyruvate isomerase